MFVWEAASAFADREHLGNAQRERQRSILHKCDNLIRDRRQDPLDDLRQNDLEKCLCFIVAQDLCCLILSHRHGLDAAAVDFRKIRGVVDHKADECQLSDDSCSRL